MTEKEIIQARNALKQWFLSQDINPADAAIVMSSLIAEQFVLKTQDVKRLSAAASTFKTMLLIDISGELRK